MSMYETGKITGKINTNLVTGTDTKWDDAKNGIATGAILVVVGTGKVDMYQISKVNSATQLTLSRTITQDFTNSPYGIIVAESNSTASFANQLTAMLSYYQTQLNGWQQILTGTGDIKLTAPDGTAVTVKSQTAFNTAVSNALDKTKNGTDIPDKVAFRKNIGLKTAAERDVGTSAGQLMEVGAFGGPTGNNRFFQVNSDGGAPKTVDWNSITAPGLYPSLLRSNDFSPNGPQGTGYYFYCIVYKYSDTSVEQWALPYAAEGNGRMLFRSMNAGKWAEWSEVHNSANPIDTSKNPIFRGNQILLQNSGRRHIRTETTAGAADGYIYKDPDGSWVIQNYINNVLKNHWSFTNTGMLQLGGMLMSNDANGIIRGAVQGGAYVDWQKRSAGLLVDCPNADTSAHQIWKATQWGRAHLAGMDIHYPTNGNIQALMHVGDANFFWHSNGVFSCQSLQQTSDIRHKKQVENITNPEEIIQSWNGKTWVYKNSETASAGLIAQDVQQKFPVAVNTASDGTLTLDYSATTGVIVEVVKNLLNRQQELEQRIQQLEQKFIAEGQ